jgi:hypothetical protein
MAIIRGFKASAVRLHVERTPREWRAGDFIFVTGTGPMIRPLKSGRQYIEQQTEETIDNISAILGRLTALRSLDVVKSLSTSATPVISLATTRICSALFRSLSVRTSDLGHIPDA